MPQKYFEPVRPKCAYRCRPLPASAQYVDFGLPFSDNLGLFMPTGMRRHASRSRPVPVGAVLNQHFLEYHRHLVYFFLRPC